MHIKGQQTGLKRNSKKVLDIIASQPVRNATQAYKQVYPNATDVTARNNASQLLKKSTAQIYLQEHINKAKSTIVDLLDSESEQIRLKSADSILDRELGKSVQRTEVSSQSLQIHIDLTSALNSDDLTEVEQ